MRIDRRAKSIPRNLIWPRAPLNPRSRLFVTTWSSSRTPSRSITSGGRPFIRKAAAASQRAFKAVPGAVAQNTLRRAGCVGILVGEGVDELLNLHRRVQRSQRPHIFRRQAETLVCIKFLRQAPTLQSAAAEVQSCADYTEERLNQRHAMRKPNKIWRQRQLGDSTYAQTQFIVRRQHRRSSPACQARRAPQSVFDYLDGGADAEVTLAENCRAFSDVTFRPRSGVAVYDCKTSVTVLGHEIAFPAILAPVSYIRLMHADGEAGVARAAGKAGTITPCPTISGHKIEDVKAAATGPLWYQLYLLGGRAAAEGAIEQRVEGGLLRAGVNRGHADGGQARRRDRATA